MASEHTVADDSVYDLISIQYPALKAAEAAPVRYRRDGSLAQPGDKDQLPPN